MSLDLYEREVADRLSTLRPVQVPEAGAFDGFFRGTGMTAMRTFAEAGRAVDMLGAVGPIVQDAFTGGTEAQDRYFREHDEVFNRAVDYWTPKPHEVGAAGEIVGQLLATLPMVIASPGFAVGQTQLGTAEDLVRKGVDSGKAQAVGAAQAAGLGLGIWMPILGQNLWQRALLGGAGFNLAQGVATRAASGAILEGTPAADEFKAFDPAALTLDVLLGLAFGGIAHLSPSQRAQGAEVWKRITDWTGNLKPSDVDAIAALRQAEHLNVQSAPGRPATPADVEAHVNRMREAIGQLARGEPVNVESMPRTRVEPDGRFAEAQVRAEAMRAEAERLRAAEGLPRPIVEEPVAQPEPGSAVPRTRGAEAEPAGTAARPQAEPSATAARVIDPVEVGERLGGVSHLRGIIAQLVEVYVRQGPDAGRARLEDMARNAPESSGFSTEVATPGFIDELDAAIRAETDGAVIGGPAGTAVVGAAARAEAQRAAAPRDPVIVGASRIAAERPDAEIVVGRDADGQPIRRRMREYLEEQRAAVKQAQESASLFEAAATCLLGGAR